MPRQNKGEPFFRVNVDEAAAMYKEKDVVFVDVRNPDEYLSGHVKGATWIPVDDVIAKVDTLPKDKRLVFICAAGVRSALACEMAAAMGVETKRLFNVDDGTPAWIAKKYPTSYGKDS
jgi:rhodanese-related sulfurtransferase